MHEEGSLYDVFVDNQLHHKANSSHDLSHGNSLRDETHSLRDLPDGKEGLHEADPLHGLQSGVRNEDGSANEVCPTLRSGLPDALCASNRLPQGTCVLWWG